MDLKQKIIDNVKHQGVLQGRLTALEEEGQRITSDLHRMGGKLELLNEIFKEQHGCTIEEMMAKDEEFNQLVRNANAEGRGVAQGTAGGSALIPAEQAAGAELKAMPVIKPEMDPDTGKAENSTGGGVTARSRNKKVDVEDPQVDVVRTRKPPKIVVTDDPPTPDDSEDD